MTKPRNPEKKHRTIKKAEERLSTRTKMYEAAVKASRDGGKGYTKPGSMKMRIN